MHCSLYKSDLLISLSAAVCGIVHLRTIPIISGLSGYPPAFVEGWSTSLGCIAHQCRTCVGAHETELNAWEQFPGVNSTSGVGIDVRSCMVKGKEMVICYQEKRGNYGPGFGRNEE